MTLPFAALPAAGSKAGVAFASLLAATLLVVRRERTRAVLVLVAIALAPLVLLADLRDSPQLDALTSQPIKAALAGAIALIAVVVLARLLAARPNLLPYLVAAALPFRIPIEIGGETSNLLVPLYLVIGAGALAWALPLALGRTEEGDSAPALLDWGLAAWLALVGAASLWSLDPSKALQDSLFFFLPFTVLFILMRRIEWTPELVRGCGAVLLVLALAASGLAFQEYWTRTLLINPKLLVSNEFHTYFRVNSVFFDPNIFGRFLMLALIGLAAVLLDSRSGRNAALSTAGALVLLAAMVLTLSQSSLAGLLCGLATLAALRWPPKVVIPVVVAGIAVGAFAIAAGPGGGLKLDSLKALNNQSSGRAGLVRGGVELFTERPIAGWGSGSFSAAYRRERGTGSSTAVTASHTTPVTAAVEQGVLGLVAYLVVVFAALGAALRRARMSTARAAVAAGLVALVVHSLTYAAFFEDPATWVLFALAAALPIPLTREERRAERESRRTGGGELDKSGSPAHA